MEAASLSQWLVCVCVCLGVSKLPLADECELCDASVDISMELKFANCADGQNQRVLCTCDFISGQLLLTWRFLLLLVIMMNMFLSHTVFDRTKTKLIVNTLKETWCAKVIMSLALLNNTASQRCLPHLLAGPPTHPGGSSQGPAEGVFPTTSYVNGSLCHCQSGWAFVGQV